MTSIRLFVVWVTFSSWIPVLSSWFSFSVAGKHMQLLLMWVFVYTNLMLHFCAKEKKTPISVKGQCLMQVSCCLERKAALRSGSHSCSRRKLVEISPGVTDQWLPSMSGNRWTGKFKNWVSGGLSTHCGTRQGAGLTQSPPARCPFPYHGTALCSQPQQLAEGCWRAGVAEAEGWSQQEEVANPLWQAELTAGRVSLSGASVSLRGPDCDFCFLALPV